ncbi:protein IQ-DOMAIN 1-like [Dorcoceras hygrometricum]|uniref:Protein IQ-DOMAIN 1-like n=1 Tax=Dorcoceras hygrometricum TaxID=472368 RepID=A0A2Z7ALS3_9LAMI|nr:protein IQ-DOMAIN 1-like [Dorcoceras hygrometricum]
MNHKLTYSQIRSSSPDIDGSLALRNQMETGVDGNGVDEITDTIIPEAVKLKCQIG